MQTTDPIEQAIQSAGADKAPRVTPADVEAAIASEWYINAGAAIVPDDFHPPVPAAHPLNQLTICVLVLRNGFTIVGKSAVVNPANFNAEIGRQVARRDAVEQIWPFLGYALLDTQAASKA